MAFKRTLPCSRGPCLCQGGGPDEKWVYISSVWVRPAGWRRWWNVFVYDSTRIDVYVSHYNNGGPYMLTQLSPAIKLTRGIHFVCTPSLLQDRLFSIITNDIPHITNGIPHIRGKHFTHWWSLYFCTHLYFYTRCPIFFY